MKILVKILLVCATITMTFSCTSLKGFVGDTVGIQTLSLEEVIKKSKSVPCEYGDDVYYKGLKIAKIDKSSASSLISFATWGMSSGEYENLLRANKMWIQKTVYYTHCYKNKHKVLNCENLEAGTRITYITKMFSLNGKHQGTVIVVNIPVGKTRMRKHEGESVVTDDAYFYIDEAKKKWVRIAQKRSDVVPYMIEFRQIMKTIVDRNPGRFPAEKISKVSNNSKKVSEESKDKTSNKGKKV